MATGEYAVAAPGCVGLGDDASWGHAKQGHPDQQHMHMHALQVHRVRAKGIALARQAPGCGLRNAAVVYLYKYRITVTSKPVSVKEK